MSQVKKMRVFKLTDSQLDLMLDAIEFAATSENLPFWEKSKRLGELIFPFFPVKIFHLSCKNYDFIEWPNEWQKISG